MILGVPGHISIFGLIEKVAQPSETRDLRHVIVQNGRPAFQSDDLTNHWHDELATTDLCCRTKSPAFEYFSTSEDLDSFWIDALQVQIFASSEVAGTELVTVECHGGRVFKSVDH